MAIRHAGYALDGYDRGVRQRQDRRDREADYEWQTNRRKKVLDDEEFYDPLQREEAGIRMKGSRRRDSFEEFDDPYARKRVQRADQTGEMEADEYISGHGIRMDMRERANRVSGMQEEDYVERRPYESRGLQRDEQREIWQDEDTKFARPYERGAIHRQEELGNLALRQGRRQDEVATADLNAFRRSEDSDSYMRNANNSIANFGASGDPTSLEDFYNNIYPDDYEVKITRLGDDKYLFQHSGGFEKETTREELMQKASEFFLEAPQAQEAGMNRGIGGGGQIGGMGSRSSSLRGGGGRGQTTKMSAYREEVTMRAESYMEQGDNRVTAFAKAHMEAGYKSRTPPDEAAQGFYKDMLQELMPDDDGLRSPEEMAEARAQAEDQAAELTDNFVERYLSRYNGNGPGIQRNQGGATSQGGEQQGGLQIPQEHIDMLINDPSPQTRAYFDEVYGEGASEAALNG